MYQTSRVEQKIVHEEWPAMARKAAHIEEGELKAACKPTWLVIGPVVKIKSSSRLELIFAAGNMMHRVPSIKCST